ncbi:MAG: hypothetical protein PVG19_12250 [Desulfobacterales bacterium]|jgi:hypothetical protein
MSFHYFYYNEFVHMLCPRTHRLFKRIDQRWVELCHPYEFQCFRLKAVELAPSEVPHFDTHHLPAREVFRPKP